MDGQNLHDVSAAATPMAKRGAEIGDLPNEATVGMAYIPMQRHGSARYDANEGLSRGTLYPGLELPFKNDYKAPMVANSPMSEVQSLAFAVGELAQYLDTHKDDKDALELYKAYQKTLSQKRAEYVKRHGPLSHQDLTETSRYSWVDNPWPWDGPEGRNA